MINKSFVPLLIAVSTVWSFAQNPAPLRPDPPVPCDDCAEWNAPHEPFRVYGNTYYVGVAGLSAVLIASDAALILLDGALPQSAPLIDRNIRALGFKTEDIRLIVNSHAHYDHSGGIAALQRASGATVAASEAGARALRQGYPTADDPQFDRGSKPSPVAPIDKVRVIEDGEVLRVGALAITAHLTPGHTPGSTTWTWQSCEGARCLDIVYADSLNAVSNDGFRFSGDGTHPSIVDRFERSIATVEHLPCDVLLTVHPAFADLDGKLAKRKAQPDPNPFIDSGACRAYASGARARLKERVAEEQKK